VMPRRRSSSVDHEIGRRVRLRRLDVGLSQTDLANALGLTFQQVQKYEKGANRISAGRLKDIARKLEVPMSYFYDEAVGSSPQSQSAFKFLDNAYSLRLIRSFARIKDRQVQQRIVEIVERLAKC
jgi:transcriptional regulator with XRE-family HTH domain